MGGRGEKDMGKADAKRELRRDEGDMRDKGGKTESR